MSASETLAEKSPQWCLPTVCAAKLVLQALSFQSPHRVRLGSLARVKPSVARPLPASKTNTAATAAAVPPAAAGACPRRHGPRSHAIAVLCGRQFTAEL